MSRDGEKQVGSKLSHVKDESMISPVIRKAALDSLNSNRERTDYDESDDLLDEMAFEFKPITKGLGFHHKEEKKSIARARTQVKKSPLRSSSSTTTQKAILQRSMESSPDGLSAFYSSTEADITQLVQTPEAKQVTDKQETNKLRHKLNKEAPKYLCAMAWIIDMIILTGALFSVSLLTLNLIEMTHIELLRILGVFDLTLYGIGIFSLFYITFFSLLDLVSTPGKALLGLKIVSSLENSQSDRVTLGQTTVRSIVSLFSIPLFAMPMLFDFQGKLSDTKIVKKAN